MRSVLILINKYFWKGLTGPLFAFLVPIILVLFIGRIMGPAFIIPGAFMIPLLSILLIFMPQSIFEFRNSSLLKRIGTTPVKPWKFLLGISIFNIAITIAALILIFVFCFIVFLDQYDTKEYVLGIKTYYELGFLDLIKYADWGSYIYFNIQIILMSILIGLLISSIARSTLFIQCVGISLMLLSLFVGPCILPISLVGSVEVVKYLGYLIPLKYPISASIEAFTSGYLNSIVNINSSNVWDVDSVYQVFNLMFIRDIGNLQNISSDSIVITIFDKVDKILNLCIPWLFMFIFAYFVSAMFRWNNRGKTQIKWNILLELYKKIREQSLNFQRTKGNPNSKNILEVKKISKTFKSREPKTVLNEISFKIKRGKNIAILGSNGAGKTVLTELIIGVDRPDKGEIIYNFDYDKSYNDGIGIQFQDSNYPVGITCKDIVSFFIKAYKLEISEEEKMKMIDKFGIKEFYNKNTSNLSGGQKQRLNLFLSIIHKPKIVFLDELSTGLDIKIRTEFKKFIKQYAKENNITLVIVSHDMDEVEFLCDEVIVLKSGSIANSGNVKNIIKKYGSLEKFLYQYL